MSESTPDGTIEYTFSASLEGGECVEVPENGASPCDVVEDGGEGDEDPDDEEDCGGDEDSSSASTASVGYLTGDKYERSTDITVRVPGRDFNLIREYSSNPDAYPLQGSGYYWRGTTGSVLPGNIGVQWNSNVFTWLGGDWGGDEYGTDIPELYLGGFPLRSHRVFKQTGVTSDSTFIARSDSNQRVTPETEVLPGFGPNGSTSSVWHLRQPGKKEIDFVRNYNIIPAGNNALGLEDLVGLPILERDDFGNTWWYEYALFAAGSSGGNRDSAVLTSIYLNWDGGADSTTKSDDTWDARVDFLWNGLQDHPNITNNGGTTDDSSENPYQLIAQYDGGNPNHHWGRLAEVRVYRPTTGADLLTQKARYEYFDDLMDIANPLPSPGSGAPNTLGELYDASKGDLCQVVVSKRIDYNYADSSNPFYEKVWQYRYYSANFVDPDPFNDVYNVSFTGDNHQLLAVFYPEQIEFFTDHHAQEAGIGAQDSAIDGADRLRWLSFADDPSVTSGQAGDGWIDFLEPNEYWHNLFDIASKVVSYYDDSDSIFDKKVRMQIVNAGDAGGCGCGSAGGARLGKRYDYLYRQYDWDPGDVAGIPAQTANSAVLMDGLTCHMVESHASMDMSTGLSYKPYRVYSHDYYRPYGIRYYTDNVPELNWLGVAWKMASVVSEADPTWNHTDVTGSPVSVSGRKWVTLYEYSSDDVIPSGTNEYSNFHKITKRYTPAAVNWTTYVASEYDSVNDSYDPPTLPSVQSGMVFESTFANGRSTSQVIRDGDSATEYVTPITMTRHAQRPDLVTQIVRSPMSTVTSPSPVEITDYEYGLSGRVVQWVHTDETAESPAQNGPDATSGTVVYSTYRMYDTNGQLRWSQDADGVLTYFEYDETTGARTLVVRDADPSGGYVDQSTASLPSSFSGLSASGYSVPTASSYEELTDSYQVDALGRVIAHTDPSGNTRYMRYELRNSDNVQSDGVLADRGVPYMTTLSFPHQLSDNSYEGPVSMSFRDASGRSIRESSFELLELPTYNPVNGFYVPQDEVQRSDSERLISGVTARSRAWHDISNTTPADMTGTTEEYLNEGSYVTHYEYDTLGRMLKTIDPEGGVMAYSEYDIRDRGLATEMGTRNWASGTDTTSLISKVYYDSDQTLTQGVGNGNVTVQESYPGVGNIRLTTMWYDYRDRMIAQENPQAPHAVYSYDDLDRVNEQALITVTNMPSTPPLPSSASNRSAYTRTHYNNRGMVFKTQTAIDPSQSSPSYLESNRWFDEDGNVIASWSPNSAATKYEYDALDRPVVVYQTDRSDDGEPGTDSYADADDVTGDHVISQTEYSYIGNGVDGAGQVELVTNRMRHHDASATGALTTSTSVATYTGYVYDDASRQTHTLSYGTNDSSGFVSATSAPTTPFDIDINTSDALISWIGFDDWGRVDRVFDPEGKESRTIFDDLSRTIATIESRANLYSTPSSNEITWDSGTGNWTVAWPTASATLTDRDRVTTFAYDGNSNVVKRTAHLNDGTSQVTQYVYGTTNSSGGGTMDSLIDSASLLSAVHYPNETSGAADTSSAYTVSYAYNRLGELKGTTDQNGTRHKISRDDLGRITSDEAEALGTNIDDAVVEITASFDTHGRIDEVQSLDNTSGVVNAVKFTYTPLHQIERVYQEHDGAVSTSGTVSDSVLYSYANAAPSASGGNYSRLSGIQYPQDVLDANGDTLTIEYGTGIDDLISRVTGYDATSWGLTDDVVSYEYLGMGMPAKVNYPNITTHLTAVQGYGGGSASGEYPGFDQYGRRIWHAWVRDSFTTGDGTYPGQPSQTPLMARRYDYDPMSNRTLDVDGRPGAVPTDRDWEYEYDELDRLKTATRGARDSELNPTSVGTIADYSRQWNLDMLGNWSNVVTDADADGMFETTDDQEDRVSNAANEITSRTGAVSGVTFSPEYDDAGNFRNNGSSSSSDMVYTHDAWNRLVKVERVPDTGSPVTVLENTFNGLNWRVNRKADLSKAAYDGLDESRDYFYSAGWQMIEEHVDRDLDGTDDHYSQQVWGARYIDDAVTKLITEIGGSSRQYYYLTDAMFSVRALTDSSGRVQERIDYSPYGVATHSYAGDVNNDGVINFFDVTPVTLNAGSSPVLKPGDQDYDPDVDSNGDKIDFFDTSAFLAQNNEFGGNPANPSGWLTDPTDVDWTDNQIGHDGYHFDYAGATDVESTGLYCVRHRVYDPSSGSWMTRDPLPYNDGSNLYQNRISNPLLYMDYDGRKPRTRIPLTDDVFIEVDVFTTGGRTSFEFHVYETTKKGGKREIAKVSARGAWSQRHRGCDLMSPREFKDKYGSKARNKLNRNIAKYGRRTGMGAAGASGLGILFTIGTMTSDAHAAEYQPGMGQECKCECEIYEEVRLVPGLIQSITQEEESSFITVCRGLENGYMDYKDCVGMSRMLSAEKVSSNGAATVYRFVHLGCSPNPDDCLSSCETR